MHLRNLSPIIFGLTLAAGSALAQNVGTVGAVNPNATGTPPNASAAHELAIGASVVNKEKIVTSAEGTTEVTFLDTSTLNVGRNSSIVIDKFVYDEQAGTGEMAASMTKGVLRFVGGQVSHTNGASLKTPVATIGIRGGTMTVIFLPGGHIMVMDQFGRIDIANNVSSQTIVRPGYAVEVDGLDIPIGPPFPIPPDVLEQAMALLGSQPGQHGGPAHGPDNLLAAQFGLGGGRLPNDPANTPGPWTIGTINLGDTFVTNRSQQQQVNGVTFPRPAWTQGGDPHNGGPNNGPSGGGPYTGGPNGGTTNGGITVTFTGGVGITNSGNIGPSPIQ
jgi:hypothetical protein